MIDMIQSNAEDIPVIQDLAFASWEVAYKDILSPDQIIYMLDLFYSKTSLKDQMTTKGHKFILAKEEEKPVGFAAYSPKHGKGHLVYHLHKLYVLPDQQGKGIGKSLLHFITNDIKPAGAKVLELKVNRHNKARYFYEKIGFTVSGELDTDIGNGYFMNDYVMLKTI